MSTQRAWGDWDEPADMVISDEDKPSNPIVVEPIYVLGRGKLVEFLVNGEKVKRLNGMRWQYHIRITDYGLYIDGVEMLNFAPDTWAAVFDNSVQI